MTAIVSSVARKAILKSRFYRVFGLLFAGVGFVVFMALLQRGELFPLGPRVILFLVVPFLPAVFLSWYSGHLEKKYFRLLEKGK